MGCPNWITTSLEEAKAILSTVWNYSDNTVTIEYDRAQTTTLQIIDTIKALKRYDVVVVDKPKSMSSAITNIKKIIIPDQSSGEPADTIDNALNAGQSMIIMFEASWCGACTQMKSQSLQNEILEQRLSEHCIIYIDIDNNPEWAKQYGVITVPDVFFFNGDGDLVDRLTNVETAEEFMSRLEGLYHAC